MPCGKKRKRHKIATHKRKKRLKKNRHKKKKQVVADSFRAIYRLILAVKQQVKINLYMYKGILPIVYF